MFPLKLFILFLFLMKDLALVDEKEIALIGRVSGLFLKKGMKRVTMDDIAKELSVSKKTLYKYVKNRKELVMKSTFFHVQRDQLKVKEIQAKNLNPIIENHELAKFVIETISNVSPCVHYDLENYFPESWKLLNGYFRGFVFESLHTNLLRGQKEGVYRSDFNAEIIAKVFASKIDMIFDAELFPTERFNFKDVYLEYLHYHLRAIVSEESLLMLKKLDFKKL